MFDFENIHRNKKLAFLDGILCGILITYFGMKIRQEIVEERKPLATVIALKPESTEAQ